MRKMNKLTTEGHIKDVQAGALTSAQCPSVR